MWSSPLGGFHATSDRLQRLIAVEAAQRRGLQLRYAEEVAELAMKVAMAATKTLASIYSAATPTAAKAQRTTAGLPLTPTTGTALPPLSAQAIEKHQQRMLRPRHGRTLSQTSDASSVGSFMHTQSNAAQMLGHNDEPALGVSLNAFGFNMTSQRIDNGSPEAGAPFLSPTTSMRRAATSIRARGTSMRSPGGTTDLSRSAASPVPPAKSHERPECHRKFLQCGRFAANPLITGSPPLRVDQVTSEAQQWQATDFIDYAAFTAIQLCVFGSDDAGKSTLIHCLTNKPPSFFKSTPKLDRETIAIRTTLHSLRGVRLPSDPVPVGGYDDTKFDVQTALKTQKNGVVGAASPGVDVMQSSATVRFVDVPMHLLERWAGTASLPVRGAMHVLTYNMAADPAVSRRSIARVVRHVLAVSAASTFPMPAVVSDPSKAPGTDPEQIQMTPMKLYFMLVGTNVDKLSKAQSDDTALQGALREEREWLQQLFRKLRATSPATEGTPVLDAQLVECYAVSHANWTVIGERPRSPRTFPDLIEHIYGSAMLHTPNGPQHIASTVLRHCASVAFMEAMQGGAPLSPSDSPRASAAPPFSPESQADESNDMLMASLRVEMARVMIAPLRKKSDADARAELPESDRMPLTGSAKLAIEQAFPELQTAYVVERSAMAREQREKVANGDTGALFTVPSFTNAALGERTSVASMAAGLMTTQQSFVAPASRTAASFANAALPAAYRDTARYLYVALSFGIATLFTSLQRWSDYAGCVLDGVIFQGLVTQHLHLKTVGARLVNVAIGHARAEGVLIEGELSDAALDAMQQRMIQDFSRRMCASLLAVGRARGMFSAMETVPSAGCNAVLLGVSLQHQLLSLFAFPRALFSRLKVSSLAALHTKRDAALAIITHAIREGVLLHDNFAPTLLNAAAELASHADLAAQIGQGAASARPPPAAAMNFNFVIEMLLAGYITTSLLESLVRRPLWDPLLQPDVLELALGLRASGLSRPVASSFMNAHRVKLPTGGGALCSAGRDFLVPALAATLAPNVASFIGLAMVTAAESASATLAGSFSVTCAPLAFATRLISAVVANAADFILALRAWRNAVVFEVCSKRLIDDSGNRIDAGTGIASTLPEGSVAYQVLIVFTDDDPLELRAKICIACSDTTPAPAPLNPRKRTASAMFSQYVIQGGRESPANFSGPSQSGQLMSVQSISSNPNDGETPLNALAPSNGEPEQNPDDFLCADADDAATMFSEWILPLVEAEALCFGRSTSMLAPEDALQLCDVTSSVSPAGVSAPWEATVAKSRELLVGLPRPAVDASLDALRRLRERSTGDLSFRPVLDPIVAFTV
jgi:hypothetical protein